MISEKLFGPPFTNSIKAGRVSLAANEEIGEHVTEKKEEVLVVIRGTATLLIEGRPVELMAGKTYYIEEGKRHNVINRHEDTLEYVYVVGMLN